jgi:hypothetical protein
MQAHKPVTITAYHKEKATFFDWTAMATGTRANDCLDLDVVWNRIGLSASWI